MKVLDPGHRYKLLTLDGDGEQVLQFVKRCDLIHPYRFPGNKDSYPGTTLQSVIQCLCERVRYLDNQIKCEENTKILSNLQECLYLLEQRAARRHNFDFEYHYEYRKSSLEEAALCEKCGHTVCEHHPEGIIRLK